MSIRLSYLVPAVLAAWLGAVASDAQVSLNNKIFSEQTTVTRDGQTTTTLVPASRMPPGTVAVYVMTYRNGGAKPASNLVISNHVPADVAFLGVADRSPAPLVSVDNGRTFGALGGLQVRGGNGVLRPASPANVTDVRWTIAGPLAPGAGGSVSYRGRVR